MKPQLKMHSLAMACAVFFVTYGWGGLASAHGDLLSAHAQINIGVADGKGVGGAQESKAFHNGAKGVATGFRVGAEALFLDGWVEHLQYRDNGAFVGTWTQMMVGADMRTDVGKIYFEFGGGVGFGVGTGQQVELPLDNAQVTDKGFVVQGQAGIGFKLAVGTSINLSVPVSWAYLFKNGIANNKENQYQSLAGSALLGFRYEFRL